MKQVLLIFAFACTLTLSGATFTSVVGGPWTNTGTWSVVGFDANGIPDSDDDIIISTGHNVTALLGSYSARSMTINPGGTFTNSTYTLTLGGSLINNGSIPVGTGSFIFIGAGTISGNPITCVTMNFQNNFTIAAGMTITSTGIVNVSANRTVNNNGTLNCRGTGTALRLFSNAVFNNNAGATLRVSGTVANAGTLDATAATNTVSYNGNQNQSIATTGVVGYYDLSLAATSGNRVKSLAGALIVLNDFTIGSFCTFQMNSNSMNLGGDWINNANTNSSSMGTVSFTGSGTQTITRATGTTERFNSIDLNGTGIVLLVDSLNLLGSLNINGGTFDVSASNYNVHLDGDFVNSAGFNARQGTFFFDGTNPQIIDGFATTTFYNLTINNAAGVTANFTKQITNILNVVNGAFGPSMFGTVQLTVTNATTYARIAPLGAGGSLTGTTWEVQSYVNGPATAYWQYCSAPTTGTTLQDWDGDTRFYMSGVGGNDGNACCPIFRSVRTYNEPTNTYTNITTVTTALTPGRGFMIWMADNLNSLTAPLIYDTRGTPNQGNVNLAVTAGGIGGGYNLVGNPYACPINYSTVVTTSGNLNANFLVLQENGTYLTSPNGGVIPPGQGFLCAATSSGNIQFTEAAKNISTTPSVIRMIPENQIKIKAGNDVNGLGEEVVIQLDPSGSETFDAYTDLPYIASPYETATHLWTSNSTDDRFILNHTSSVEDHLMIPFTVVSSTIGVQSLTFKDLNSVTAYNCAWLEDTENGQRINLNMNDTYSFEESELGVEHKFVLHFERTNDCEQDLQKVDPSLEAQTSVYVNSGNVYAQFGFADESMVTISMYDMNGRAVMGETNMSVSNQTVPLTAPDAHGIYIVRIVKDGEAVSKKFYY